MYSLLSLTFSQQQNQRRRGQIRFCLEGGGKVAKTMYTHVSKYKNSKIKNKKIYRLRKNIENYKRQVTSHI
jgi:hypothetical protein